MIIAVICIIVVLLIIVLWAVFTNNSLIAKKNRVKQCRSGICVVLKQRNNLIPNLVASVKAYMGHENEILTRIADLRSRASNATESEQIKSGTEMSSLLSRLNVAVEDYPELKAFTVQFHPEACTGPKDTSFLFDRFVDLMKGGEL